ncbi:MAG TPA: choice-of-anchor tandem repeat GloVer-containing protein [Verrucomicrobiae bacterium]|nr:choice-of-anchor tandem repeat GloVer-containing protein [Verrucomicrobiae bacterium]
MECYHLTDILIPNSVTSIGDGAFELCSGLRGDLTIPDSVTDIGSFAFGFCTGLTNLSFGNGISFLGDLSFTDCTNLTTIYFSGDPPSCGSGVFFDDPATVYYMPGAENWGPYFGGVPTAPGNGGRTQYSVAVSASPVGDGNVSGGGTYPRDGSATVAATSNPGYQFVNWADNGTAVSSSASYTFTVNNDVALVANFSPTNSNVSTIVVSTSPAHGGTVAGAGPYQSGSSATVTATANPGYQFVGWMQDGIQVSTSASYTFTAGANTTLVADFEPIYVTVVLNSSPNIAGTVGGGGTYQEGGSATVTATNNPGYQFVNWTENGTSISSSGSYTFTVNGNVTLSANFTPINDTVEVSASPTNGGDVVGTGTYQPGTSVTVVATPNSPGYQFVNWTENGIAVSSLASYTFTVSSNETLVANFAPIFYSVAVNASPTNGGTVGGSGTYQGGSTVTVMATNNPGYLFTNWTVNGNPVNSSSSYSFTLSTNITLVAHFNQIISYTVAVSASPGNAGTVTGGGTYPAGSSVTVTATNNASYQFVSWTVDGTVVSSTPSYNFTANGNLSLVANFLRFENLSFVTLHNFSGPDGASPVASLILNGNKLYGTTESGGAGNYGTIFSVGSDGTGFTNLYIFNGTDGDQPAGGLTQSGTVLYGTTSSGGIDGWGSVFAIETDGSGFTNLYSFTGGNDGAQPLAGLLLSADTLYGTAEYGGTNQDGTTFAVSADGTDFITLYPFAGSDGMQPSAGLILSENTLYGTTTGDGSSSYGTVFAVNTDGTGFTNLYSFTGQNDGSQPAAGLVLSGNTLYGTAEYGGTFNGGTIFAINTDGTGFTNLYTFTGENDGYAPVGTLVLSSNILYGAAKDGGLGNDGTVFAINTDGSNFSVLHSFTALDENYLTNSDGAYPVAGLVLSGNTLFGTTLEGGTAGQGTVFALPLSAVAPQPPTISSPTHFSNGNFQMTVSGNANQNYSVQMSTVLGSTNWTTLLVTNSSSGSFLFIDPNATNQQRFYRILVGP